MRARASRARPTERGRRTTTVDNTHLCTIDRDWYREHFSKLVPRTSRRSDGDEMGKGKGACGSACACPCNLVLSRRLVPGLRDAPQGIYSVGFGARGDMAAGRQGGATNFRSTVRKGRLCPQAIAEAPPGHSSTPTNSAENPLAQCGSRRSAGRIGQRNSQGPVQGDRPRPWGASHAGADRGGMRRRTWQDMGVSSPEANYPLGARRPAASWTLLVLRIRLCKRRFRLDVSAVRRAPAPRARRSIFTLTRARLAGASRLASLAIRIVNESYASLTQSSICLRPKKPDLLDGHCSASGQAKRGQPSKRRGGPAEDEYAPHDRTLR